LVLKTKITVTYDGADPPKTVLLSLALESTDPTHVATQCADLTQSLGPWVSIGPSLWTLNLTAYQPIPFLDYLFPFEDNGQWPNEKSNITVFAAYSARTISGDEQSVAATLGTSNTDLSTRYCYYLGCSQLSTVDTTIYAGENPTPDDPRGCFFSLVLSHEHTPAASFSYLPMVLNIIYPILGIIFLAVIIVSASRRYGEQSRVILGAVITSNLTLIVLLFTFRYWIVGYVPPWIVSVYAKIDSMLIWMFALFAVIIVLTLITRSVGIGLYKFLAHKIRNL
jgi:hypothetical protein